MNSSKINKILPNDHWLLYVNGYKNPYDYEASWANDWLDGGIKLMIDGKEQKHFLNLLIVEELEDFIRWLTKWKDGAPVADFFQFLDTELCFEVVRQRDGILLRMKYGLESDKQIQIDTSISNAIVINLHIQHIRKLLDRFPCRCNAQHAQLIN